MSEGGVNLGDQAKNELSDQAKRKAKRGASEIPALSTEETAQLLLASSLAATRPLLVVDGFPPATKAMLDPIWKSLIAQIGETQAASPRREGDDNG
jgi:hypothetical protein